MDSGKIKQTLSDAKVYWKRPMPGRYMPFKEIFAYSFGGKKSEKFRRSCKA